MLSSIEETKDTVKLKYLVVFVHLNCAVLKFVLVSIHLDFLTYIVNQELGNNAQTL